MPDEPPASQEPISGNGPGAEARQQTRPEPNEDGSESGEESFRELLDRSLGARAFEDGQAVRGSIVSIGPDVAFVDIGGKSEATVDLEELKDSDGRLEAAVGDAIEAIVVSTEGGLRLSRKLSRGAASRQEIEDAFRAGLPVEGRVEKTNKGGFEVRVAGQRAFCPVSQIDLIRSPDPSVHEGKVYAFRIVELREGGKNIVVSRRAILEEEEKKKAEETLRRIAPGAVLTGRVVSVREYGAFVDLGGLQGLLHVSEMGWGRVARPGDIVKPGDEVTVKVLRVDPEKGKVSLGLKQLQEDPWTRACERFAVGQVLPGKVLRLQEFGAFVELEPGIEALAHVSTFAPTGTPGGWRKAVSPGTNGMFEVLSVEPERKRIGVALVTEPPAGRSEPKPDDKAQRSDGSGALPGVDRRSIVPGARLTGKVERHERFGVFVFLAPGRTGLMPVAESGLDRGADLRKAFPTGSELEVAVLEVDPSGKRIRLSRKALLQEDEKEQARGWVERTGQQESFGSIGEKLRAALADRRK